MNWFNQIKIWSQLPLKQRMNMLMGAIIVVLCFVIVNDQYQLYKADKKLINTTDKINAEHAIIVTILQTRIDECNKSYLQYLQKNEKETRDILFEVKKVKEEINGN